MSPKRTSPRRQQQTQHESSGSPGQTTSPPLAATVEQQSATTTLTTTPPQGKIAAARRARAYERPAGVMGNGAMLLDDLVGFGFTTNEIKALNSLQEPEVDNYAQVKHGSYASAKLARMNALEAFERKRASRRGAIAKKQSDSPPGVARSARKMQVVVGGAGSNWVLFDPNRPLPPTVEGALPAAFERLSRFKPGNPKVVAYNTESFCISLRKTPSSFHGHEVQYLNSGPKLVKLPARKDSVLDE